MKPLFHAAAWAALASMALPAQALLVSSAASIAAPSATINFESFDGLLTGGTPQALASDLSFTGDVAAELGAFNRDLGENGAWGVGNHFAAAGTPGELRFSFDGLSQGAGAFVNVYSALAAGSSLVVTAYSGTGTVLETHTVLVNTTFDGYNEGQFVGITRAAADIATLTFTGSGVVADDFIYTSPIPEPSTYALLGCGLAVLVGVARRRRAAA